MATALKRTNIFVRQLMSQSYPLRLVLDGLAIHNGVLELLNDGLVDSITLQKGQKALATEAMAILTKSSTVELFFRRTTGVL